MSERTKAAKTSRKSRSHSSRAASTQPAPKPRETPARKNHYLYQSKIARVL